MPSVLTSGNGLDGLKINVQGAFASLGSANGGLAVAQTQVGLVGTANTAIYQGSEADVAAMLTASSGTTRQVIFAGPTVAPNDYILGVEVAQGDRNAAERGDLNNISSMYEVVTTGYSLNSEGGWISPTGATLTSRATFGSSVNLGSDSASGAALRFTTTYGSASGATVSVFTPAT